MSEYLNLYEVVQMTGLSVSTIYNQNKKCEIPFPKRIKIDGHHVVWDKSEIKDWMCRKNQKKSTYQKNMSID